MKKLTTLFLCAWLPAFAANYCTPGLVNTPCPNPGALTTGVQANTVPAVYCAPGQSYSLDGNSLARTVTYCYLNGADITSKNGAILVVIHGDGDAGGNSLGSFLFSSGTESMLYPVQIGYVASVVDLNYTQYANGAGTNAPNPAPISDILCGLGWIAAKAGVSFPGNPNDLRGIAFSWGTHPLMLAAWNPGAYSSTCEWPLSGYAITKIGLDAPLWNMAGQWPTAADGTFVTAIQNAFGPCSGSGCPPLFAPYDVDALGFPNASSVRLVALVTGSTDTTTNPTYQSTALNAAEAALGNAVVYSLDSGAPHGGQCHNYSGTNNLYSPWNPCWAALMQVLSEPQARTASSGGSMVAGSSF